MDRSGHPATRSTSIASSPAWPCRPRRRLLATADRIYIPTSNHPSRPGTRPRDARSNKHPYKITIHPAVLPRQQDPITVCAPASFRLGPSKSASSPAPTANLHRSGQACEVSRRTHTYRLKPNPPHRTCRPLARFYEKRYVYKSPHPYHPRHRSNARIRTTPRPKVEGAGVSDPPGSILRNKQRAPSPLGAPLLRSALPKNLPSRSPPFRARRKKKRGFPAYRIRYPAPRRGEDPRKAFRKEGKERKGEYITGAPEAVRVRVQRARFRTRKNGKAKRDGTSAGRTRVLYPTSLIYILSSLGRPRFLPSCSRDASERGWRFHLPTHVSLRALDDRYDIDRSIYIDR